jgi:hypothetical protein
MDKEKSTWREAQRAFGVFVVFIIEVDCVLCEARTEAKTTTETACVLCGETAEAEETVEH